MMSAKVAPSAMEAGQHALLPFVLEFLPPLPPDSPPLAIDAIKVVTTLMVAQFIPMCLGLGSRQWRPTLADRLRKPANLISMVLNLTTLSLIFFARFDMLIGVPLRGYVEMLALVLAGVAAGWLLGGSGNASAW